MNQPNEHVNPIKPPTRKNKNFLYKGKKYPVDFSLVKKYSNYFYNKRRDFKYNNDIEIKPNNYEITDESLSMFIACCQNEPFDINASNVFTLRQLSIQYEVSVLQDLSNQYIEKNQKPLIFQSISYKLQIQESMSDIDLSQEEDFIASNFFEFINDDHLISLPVPILYNIINKKPLKINSLNLTNQGEFIQFLFKCLDKHKRKASILFLNLDLENERIPVLTELLNRFPDVFDFNFIDSKYMAKSASLLMSEVQRLKAELANKIAEIETVKVRQSELFTEAQNQFNHSKSELERRVERLEREMGVQAAQIARYTKVKVSEIQINCEPNFLRPNPTVILTACVKPEWAFNDGVEWRIEQDEEGTVRVESKDDRSLVLMGLLPKKVTVVAEALDGSGATASKDIFVPFLKGMIEINVQQDQFIKGRIHVTEVGGGPLLDKSRSRYVLNTRGDAVLGESAYKEGQLLDSLDKEVSFSKPAGDYFMHALLVDNFGGSLELVSQQLHTSGAQFCCGYTRSVQAVELDPGSYKLEAWGAQGGSFDSTCYGGYGGYATGKIKLSSRTTVYVAVGKSTSDTSGGYNGGGSGGLFKWENNTFTSFGGGGASHIGLKSAELSDFSGDYSTNLLIVAAGGGGAIGTTGQLYITYNTFGGCGGGFKGSDGNSIAGTNYAGTGGDQSQGGKNNYGWVECGSFGKGSNCGEHSGYIKGGGGGGGFYGGGSGGNAGSGGGGSGYINTSKLSEAVMYGYGVPESSSTECKTIPTSNVSTDAVSNYAKKNDGYVKITPL